MSAGGDEASRGGLRARVGSIMAASIAACVATPVYLLGVYLPAFNTPHTPIEGVSHARSAVPAAPAFARHLAFVVVDGLSFARALGRPELEALRAEGAIRPLAVDFPSYTSPSLTAMVTGLGPRDSGIRLNGDETGVPGMDSLLPIALEAGVPVRVRSRGWPVFERLMRASPAVPVIGGHLAFEVDAAMRRARGSDALAPLDGRGPSRALSITYVEEIDAAGHEHGLASDAYAAAEAFAVGLVARYAARLDLRQDMLVVASDHGHLPQGGHGGDEPDVVQAFLLVAGGPSPRGVVLGERPMRDVASTLSVLAGLPSPSTNLGRPMLDLLPPDAPERALALATSFDQVTSFACRVQRSARCDEAAGLTARLRAGDGEAVAGAELLLATLEREREVTIAGDVGKRAWTRLGIAGAALLLAAFAAGRRLLAGPFWAPSLPVLHGLAYAAVLRGFGYGASFSRMGPADVFFPHAAVAATVGAVLATLVVRLAPGQKPSPWWMLLGTAIPFALLAAWVGADAAGLVPPVEGVLLFFGGPWVLGGAVSAAAITALVKVDLTRSTSEGATSREGP